MGTLIWCVSRVPMPPTTWCKSRPAASTACGCVTVSNRWADMLMIMSGLVALSPSLGNCSRHCPRPPAPGAVYLAHPWARTSSAAVPDAALDNCSCLVLPSPIHGLVPPPSMESCIHAVVSRRERGVNESSNLPPGFRRVRFAGFLHGHDGAFRCHDQLRFRVLRSSRRRQTRRGGQHGRAGGTAAAGTPRAARADG